jgi:hypothetical protein
MPSSKLLNGVAHDIAHHAMSGLSYLHPHLSETCRKAGIAGVTLDLTSESPLPSSVPDYQPLRLASQALHRTFVGILESVGFTLADVSAARLTFSIVQDAPDDYSYVSCTSELSTTRGQSYRHDIPAFSTTGVSMRCSERRRAVAAAIGAPRGRRR